ncbi:CapA family protein [Oceanobacillus timonensis]|uniref:CapA family protein n=1 Tax=Oceanobacillus timonensis TaxID=1926285 RepID=UPI0009BBF664|nr:CapA family protein [Oceanobacillus timonensis]
MTIAATGDSFITRRLPSYSGHSFQRISQLLQNADVRFTNLEVTTHQMEGYPSAVSGGTWAMAAPEVLHDLKAYGFNLYAWANNHTMDYSQGGLLATKRYLNKHGLVHGGVGENLAEASSPKYLETSSGRVALISATSTFHESWRAGEQRPDMIGRPGVNPLRYSTTHYVTKPEMKKLQEIADSTFINADHNLAVKEGFEIDEKDEFSFGPLRFIVGESRRKETKPFPSDMKRLENAILEARRQADVVIVSIHSHEMKEENKALPAQFLEMAARNCIDSGADTVIGHGPHILRGIEVYQEKPIFYSLGNFIFHNETVSALPADFYEKYNLNYQHNVADALDQRSDNNTKGLGANPFVWESVIAEWDIKEKKVTNIRLHPIELGFDLPRYRKGWPELSNENSDRILKNLQKLSKPYGTTIEIKDGVGIIRF